MRYAGCAGPGPIGSAASATAVCWPTKWRASWKRTASGVEFLGLVNPSVPAQRSLLRMVCNSVAARGRDGQARPELFLRTRHALRHVYRHARPNDQRVADFGALLSIEPRLGRMFPASDALFEDYVGVLSWAMGGYRPEEYGGKITFFWAAEEPEIADSWQPVLRHKHPATIEQHTVPGDHLTTVTVGIAELAQSMAENIDRLASESVGASSPRRATQPEAGRRGAVRICDLRAADITTVIGIQRCSFPRDPWTLATANGRFARLPVGRDPRLARWGRTADPVRAAQRGPHRHAPGPPGPLAAATGRQLRRGQVRLGGRRLRLAERPFDQRGTGRG